MLGIAGLSYLSEYIDQSQHDHLMDRIDGEAWLNDLKRRVQHYGWRYDYKKRGLDPSGYLGPLPPHLAELAVRLHVDGRLPNVPDQCIVNEYVPGQGITAHVDCRPCFGDGIASLSLGSDCVMEFSPARERGAKLPILLERQSLIVLTGSARYDWLHAIPQRKTDHIDGRTIVRGRRVSLTFRTALRA